MLTVFVREYAKAAGVNPDEVLQMLQGYEEPETVVEAPPPPPPRELGPVRLPLLLERLTVG